MSFLTLEVPISGSLRRIAIRDVALCQRSTRRRVPPSPTSQPPSKSNTVAEQPLAALAPIVYRWLVLVCLGKRSVSLLATHIHASPRLRPMCSGVCNAVTANLLTNPVSGLMGLAFNTLSTSKATPFWQTLANTNAWDQPLMAFHLTRFASHLPDALFVLSTFFSQIQGRRWCVKA